MTTADLSYTALEQISTLIRETAERALEKVLAALGPEHAGKGAYLRVYHLPKIEEGYIGLIELFAAWIGGQANVDRFNKCFIVSVEKAIRLATNARLFGHISSWESRDSIGSAHRDKFGGAILVRCIVPELGPEPTYLLFTLSGLPEVGDEAMVLLTASSLPWQASDLDLSNIMLRSQNRVALDLIDPPPSQKPCIG